MILAFVFSISIFNIQAQCNSSKSKAVQTSYSEKGEPDVVDIAIGSKLSKFCLSEVKLGLIPAIISPYVIKAMSARSAKRYFMTAEVFSSRRARRLGLIDESVTEEALD